ncbi:MAG: DUF4912 domain-containing protein, partial [Eubacteriales bacterium]
MVFTVPQYGFPTKYNDNYIVLLVRDPHCIFGYWELSDEQMNLVAKEFQCQWGKVPLILRVYDLTGLNFDGENSHSHFDIAIHALANNYYVKEVNANRSYCVDLGVITSEGRFVTLLRSNVVLTPRDSLADGSGIVMADLLDRLMTVVKDAEPVGNVTV